MATFNRTPYGAGQPGSSPSGVNPYAPMNRPFPVGSTSANGAGSSSSSSALQSLISSLGYVPGHNKKMAAVRTQEIGANQGQRAQYSKEAAMADSAGMIQKIVRESMEKNMSALTRSAEGAGASASSLRALMAQDLITRTAGEASTAGINAAAQYGNVSNNYSQVIEALSRPDTGSLQALVSALGIGASGGGGSGGQGSRPAAAQGGTRPFAGLGNSGTVGQYDSRMKNVSGGGSSAPGTFGGGSSGGSSRTLQSGDRGYKSHVTGEGFGMVGYGPTATAQDISNAITSFTNRPHGVNDPYGISSLLGPTEGSWARGN